MKLTRDYSRVACDVQSCGVEGSEVESEKTGKPVNPWAVCHAKLGPAKNQAFEDCVQGVKRDHPIKRD